MKQLHTHYDNLKVTRNAPPEVIRAAYKTLCHKFHPDHHHGDPSFTQTFQLISAAYRVLSDPEQRRVHDQWIASAEAGLTGQGNRGRAQQVRRAGDRRRTPHRWHEQQLTALNERLRRSSRQMAFWTSLILIGGMMVLLIIS